MNCEQLRELSLDFVYDELAPDERAALQAHAQSCPACTAELASLQGTLQNTRAALRGVLDEEPPAGVRTRLHALAREHIDSGAQLGPLQRAWHVLRRPWLLPVLAAATAVVIGLSRQLSPRPVPVEELNEVEFRAPNRVGSEPAASPDERYEPDEPPDAFEMQVAPAPAAAPAASPAEPALARAAPAAKRSARREVNSEREDFAAPAKPVTQSNSAAPSATHQDTSPAEARAAPRTRGFAVPPSESPTKTRPKDVRIEAEGALEASERGRAAAPLPASPRAPRSTRANGQSAADEERDLGSLADSAASDNARAPGLSAAGAPLDKQSASTLTERIERANQAFVQQRWAAAAIAYRELLRDYPTHRAASSWERRLQRAEAARAKSRAHAP